MLKSGCKIEQLQLQRVERIERAGALLSIVAWQILWYTYESRKNPDLACTRILTSKEWQLLVRASGRKRYIKPPTIYEAVRMIASLGGFLGRTGDGEPGVQTLWIGMQRFADMRIGMRLTHGSLQVVGKV